MQTRWETSVKPHYFEKDHTKSKSVTVAVLQNVMTVGGNEVQMVTDISFLSRSILSDFWLSIIWSRVDPLSVEWTRMETSECHFNVISENCRWDIKRGISDGVAHPAIVIVFNFNEIMFDNNCS